MIRPFRTFRQLGQRGDTIVEVLIVLAVLGLAMSIAYATANKGLQQSRNAQEHSQALGLINSQVELMRSAFAGGSGGAIEAMATPPPAKPFCLSATAAGVQVNPIKIGGLNPFNDTSLAGDHLNVAEYTAACNQNTLYYVSVISRGNDAGIAGNNVYDFRVRWEGLGSLGRQQEEITYKIGNVTTAGVGDYVDPGHVPPPTTLGISLNASSYIVNENDGVTIDWSTTPNADSCTLESSASGSKLNESSSGTQPFSLNGSGGSDVNFTMTCTLGSQPPVSKTITVHVLKAYTFKGSDFTLCTPAGADVCRTDTSPTIHSVYSCSPFTAAYKASSQSVPAGTYNLRLNYSNRLDGCDDPSYGPLPASYSFNVIITVFHQTAVGGRPGQPGKPGRTVNVIDSQQTVNLPSGSSSKTIDLGAVNTDSQISIQWTNDLYDTTKKQDANFQITSFDLISK